MASFHSSGYTNDYQFIEQMDPNYLNSRGLHSRGTKVKFLERNGTDWHRNQALEKGLKVGDILTVKSCDVGSWSSSYKFEEVPGSFNTVMFEAI